MGSDGIKIFRNFTPEGKIGGGVGTHVRGAKSKTVIDL